MFYHDSSGYVEQERGKKEFPLLPAGQWFKFRIIDTKEKKTSKGLDMVEVVAEVIETPDFNGARVWHYVTFMTDKKAKGFGMSVHFRKCIGEPTGNEDLVDCLRWIGRTFMASIKHESYEGKVSAKFKAINAVEGQKQEEEIQF